MYDRQYHHSRILSGPVSVLSDVDPTEATMSVDIAHLGGDTSIQFNFNEITIIVVIYAQHRID